MRANAAMVILLFPLGAPGQALFDPSAVSDRRGALSQKWELGASFATTLAPNFTHNQAFSIFGAYNFNQYFALEVRGTYSVTGLSAQARQLRDTFAANTAVRTIDELSGLWQMQGSVAAAVRFSPLYGKLNLGGILPLTFQVSLWAGGGAAFLNRESTFVCTTAIQGGGCADYWRISKVSASFVAALGMRFFFERRHAVSFAIRVHGYGDNFYTDIVRAQVSPTNPVPGGVANSAIYILTQFEFGYAFVF